MVGGQGSIAMVDRSAREQIGWCFFYGAGIIGTLVLYGVLQERIMTIPFGDDGMFKYSVFLVFMNRVFAVVFSLCMVRLNNEEMRNSAPWWKYLIISFSNVYASTCQYEALKYVSFAVQMLCKSFKMLPVMLWGIAINGKRYEWKDWLVAAAVTVGVTEFLMTGPTAAPTDRASSPVGFCWLMAFLALDGLTSTMQEKLFKEHKTTKYNQMLYVNALSSVVSLATLTTTGQLVPAFGFWLAEPRFLADSLTLSAFAVSSQWFIYSQVKEFGALVFAATMNVRQVVSILVSYMKYHHPITVLQVFGLLAVFAALFCKSFFGMQKQTEKGEQQHLVSEKEEAGKEGTTTVDYKAADKA